MTDAGPGRSPADDERARLRTVGRSARNRLEAADRAAAEARIRAGLLEVLRARAGRSVGLTWPTDGEPDLRPVAGAVREEGGTVLLPVIDAGSLRFRSWDAGTELRPNRYGIPEPVGAGDVPVEDLDVVVVPAVAVDAAGNRLGFGAGFYDRALAGRTGRTLLVGAVFEGQVVDRVPTQPWDVPLDVVVTERRVLRPG